MQAFERKVGAAPSQDGASLGQCIGCQQGPQVGKTSAQRGTKVYHATVDHRTETGPAVALKTDEFHVNGLQRVARWR